MLLGLRFTPPTRGKEPQTIKLGTVLWDIKKSKILKHYYADGRLIDFVDNNRFVDTMRLYHLDKTHPVHVFNADFTIREPVRDGNTTHWFCSKYWGSLCTCNDKCRTANAWQTADQQVFDNGTKVVSSSSNLKLETGIRVWNLQTKSCL